MLHKILRMNEKLFLGWPSSTYICKKDPCFVLILEMSTICITQHSKQLSYKMGPDEANSHEPQTETNSPTPLTSVDCPPACLQMTT